MELGTRVELDGTEEDESQPKGCRLWASISMNSADRQSQTDRKHNKSDLKTGAGETAVIKHLLLLQRIWRGYQHPHGGGSQSLQLHFQSILRPLLRHWVYTHTNIVHTLMQTHIHIQ